MREKSQIENVDALLENLIDDGGKVFDGREGINVLRTYWESSPRYL